MKERKIYPFREHGNYVQAHNILFDEVMPKVKPTSWKVLCFILRETKGWGKTTAELSFKDLMTGTGISGAATIAQCTEELLSLGCIIIRKKISPNGIPETNKYSLNLNFSTIAPLTSENEVDTSEIEVAPTSEIEVAPTSKNEVYYKNNKTHRKTVDSAEKNNSQNDVTNIESPIAKVIREICGKRTLQLSPKDRKDLEFVLSGLHQEGATIEQAEEFGRKVKHHWIGIDSRTKQPQAPRIMQVLEYWYPVLEMEIKTGKAKTTPDDLAAIKAKYA